MQLIKKVFIKQVITEQSKQTLRNNFESEMIQLERECQQLLFEQRKLKHRVTSKEDMAERFQMEINQRKNKIEINEFKLEQLELLEIGNEIIEKEMEGLVDVEVGMNWEGFDKQMSIIIEDGVVIRMDKE